MVPVRIESEGEARAVFLTADCGVEPSHIPFLFAEVLADSTEALQDAVLIEILRKKQINEDIELLRIEGKAL